MPDTEAVFRQLIAVTGIPVPEDEIVEMLEGFDGILERVENIYSVPVGDTPPTSMLRVEA